jgi:hypothetical protein
MFELVRSVRKLGDKNSHILLLTLKDVFDGHFSQVKVLKLKYNGNVHDIQDFPLKNGVYVGQVVAVV